MRLEPQHVNSVDWAGFASVHGTNPSPRLAEQSCLSWAEPCPRFSDWAGQPEKSVTDAWQMRLKYQERQCSWHVEGRPSGRRSSEKWDGGRAPTDGGGERRGVSSSYLWGPVRGVTPEKFVKIYTCKSVQYGYFEVKIRILNNSMSNLDFGRSIWRHLVIRNSEVGRKIDSTLFCRMHF